MPKQTIEEKALAYIAAGKISVREVDIARRLAHVRAQGTRPQPYNVHFTEGGWTCDCPAIVNGQEKCAHIVAAKRLVPDLRPSSKPKIGQEHDMDLDEFLADLCPAPTGKPGEDFSLDEL